MKHSLDLNLDQRIKLLDLYRGSPDPEVRFRSHTLLLLSDSHTWATVAAHKPGRRSQLDPSWVQLAVE